MSWKFNPPPGWPEQPEGWQPPPGWAPDPSWPPAPPGWQFWVPAGSAPEPASPAPTVHDAPTSLANPTVPTPGSGQPAQPGSPFTAGTPSPASPAAPQSPAGTPPGSGQPGGSYPPPGPFPPTAGYPPGGAPPAAATGGKPWFQQWWAITGTVLAVLLVGCLGGAGTALLTDSGDDPPQPQPTNAAPSTGTPPTESPTTDPSQGPGPGGDGLGPGEQQSGQGPTIIPLDLPSDSLHMARFTYTGDGYFSATLIDDQGEFVNSMGRSPFNTFDYTGTWPIEPLNFFGEEGSAIEITDASGEWTVEILDVSEAPVWPDVTEGSGDTVLQIDPAAAGDIQTVLATHDGESNFVVWAYSADRESYQDVLVFNEIGPVDGAADEVFTSQQAILHIQADGNWTLTAE